MSCLYHISINRLSLYIGTFIVLMTTMPLWASFKITVVHPQALMGAVIRPKVVFLSAYSKETQPIYTYFSENQNLTHSWFDTHKLAWFYYQLGKSQQLEKQYNLALNSLSKAEQYARYSMQQNSLAHIYRLQGLINFKLRKFPIAANYLFKAIVLMKLNERQLEIFSCYSTLGTIYGYSGNYQQCIAYNRKAIHLLNLFRSEKKGELSSEKQKELSGIDMNLHANLANAYASLADYHSALYHYKYALALQKDKELVSGATLLFANAAVAYRAIGDVKKSYELLKLSLKQARDLHLNLEEANALHYLGYYAPNLSEAEFYFFNAIQIARQQKYVDLLKGIYRDWANKAISFGDNRKALLRYKEYDHLKDSLIRLEQLARIDSLEATFELTIAKAQLKKVMLEHYNHAVRLRLYLTSAFLLLALLAIVVIFYIISRKNNDRLRKKSRQLEELNDFKSKVFSIIGHDVSGIVSSMSAILYILKSESLTNKDQQEFVTELIELKDNVIEMLNKLFLWGSSENAISRKQRIEIPGILEETIDMCVKQAQARGLEFERSQSVSGVVFADREQVNFIVRNLLTNAIKFALPGTRVKISFYKSEDDIVILVANTGSPISLVQLKNIFNKAIDTLGEGKGTGLVLCKRIADMEGFHLELIQSDVEVTLFSLRISMVV